MIWGSCAGYLTERAARWLIPGLERNRADGDQIILTHSDRIAVGYNQILRGVQSGPVVLLHDDVELLVGARYLILEALQTADVVGVIGASDLSELAWWTAPDQVGYVRHTDGTIDRGPHGPVDAVDGLLLAFSPRAARRLRFDEEYPGFHGYDADICYQARAEGLTVTTADIPLIHHTNGGFGDHAAWNAAVVRWRSKWSA